MIIIRHGFLSKKSSYDSLCPKKTASEASEPSEDAHTEARADDAKYFLAANFRWAKYYNLPIYNIQTIYIIYKLYIYIYKLCVYIYIYIYIHKLYIYIYIYTSLYIYIQPPKQPDDKRWDSGVPHACLHTALTLDTQCSDQEKVEPPEPDSCDEEAEVTTWDWIGYWSSSKSQSLLAFGASHFCLEYPWIFLSLWVEYQEDLGPESTDKTRRLSGTGTIPFPTGTPFRAWKTIQSMMYDIYIYDIYIYDIYIYIWYIYMIYIYMIYIYIYIYDIGVSENGVHSQPFFSEKDSLNRWKGVPDFQTKPYSSEMVSSEPLRIPQLMDFYRGPNWFMGDDSG